MTDDDLGRASERWRRLMAGRLNRAAGELSNELKRVLSVPADRARSKKTGRWYATTPAVKGAPPRKLSGRLRASVTYTVDAGKLLARVGTNVGYGSYLEHGTGGRAHPWLRVTFNRALGRIRQILRGP